MTSVYQGAIVCAGSILVWELLHRLRRSQHLRSRIKICLYGKPRWLSHLLTGYAGYHAPCPRCGAMAKSYCILRR